MADLPSGYTTNYHISKWNDGDNPGAAAINANWELIDNSMKGLLTASSLGVTSSYALSSLSSSYVSSINWNNISSKPIILSSSLQISSEISGSSTIISSSLASRTSNNSNDISNLQVKSIYSGSFTGSLLGTSSIALNAYTASYLLGAISSASYSTYAVTASLLLGSVVSASYALTASYAQNSTGVGYWTSSADYIKRVSNVQITGSLNTSAGITGSLLGSSSYALTSSYSLNSFWTSSTSFINRNSNVNITGSLNVSSAGITGSLLGSSSYALSSSYSITSATASYYNGNVVSSSYALSSSFALNVKNTGSYSYTNLNNIPTGIISSSIQINTGSFSGSFKGDGTNLNNIVTSSYALTASLLLGSVVSASYAPAQIIFVKAYATSSDVIITIPSSSTIIGKTYIIKADSLASGNIIVTGSGEQIDSYGDFTITNPFGYVWIYSNGNSLSIVNY